MSTAFLGYVLPWGQMRYWGATVITSLFSAFPYVGDSLVLWLWGGFAVGNATLTRFFSLHFLIPFFVAALAAVHIWYLHGTGRNNPLGLSSGADKIPFHSYFTFKDVLGFIIFLFALSFFVFFYPFLLGEPDNFIAANAMSTPSHIVPEWYFLFAYAVLRAIPNKLGGVVGLLCSVLLLATTPLNKSYFKSRAFYPVNKSFFWLWVLSFFLLTYRGACPVEAPYVLLSKVSSLVYFSYFLSIRTRRLTDRSL